MLFQSDVSKAACLASGSIAESWKASCCGPPAVSLCLCRLGFGPERVSLLSWHHGSKYQRQAGI